MVAASPACFVCERERERKGESYAALRLIECQGTGQNANVTERKLGGTSMKLENGNKRIRTFETPLLLFLAGECVQGNYVKWISRSEV